jgi:hypothetical protein
MTLKWEERSPGGWFALRNGWVVGLVVVRDDGVVIYEVTAVSTKWVTKGYGEVRSIASAKRGLERAWTAWLDAHGLVPREEATGGMG